LDTMEPKYIDNSTGIPRVIEDIFRIRKENEYNKSLLHVRQCHSYQKTSLFI